MDCPKRFEHKVGNLSDIPETFLPLHVETFFSEEHLETPFFTDMSEHSGQLQRPNQL